VHFTANVGPNEALPLNNSIELTFDRLLLPLSIVRQTFVLEDIAGNALTPNVAYDPVSRIVSVTPAPDAPFTVGQTYQITVATPQSGIPGLLAIDGATLDPAESPTLTFLISDAVGQTGVTPVDYCTDINPIFQAKCGGLVCHSPPPESQQADGLVLTEPWGVTATAIGRVAVGANTGPRPTAEGLSLTFGLDMPIIPLPGAGGPADSWLMYKLLMAVPSPGPAVPAPEDGGAVEALSTRERAILASLIPGREMPFPTNPAAPLTAAGAQLTIEQLETVSSWIAEGAVVPASCP
jgi:hypothetical protein